MSEYPEIQELTDEKVAELARQPGNRVIRTREVPATVKDLSELWPSAKVKSWFLQLVSSRQQHDASHHRDSMTAAERAWNIASRVCSDPKEVMEFRRIYPTIWRYALARTGTTPEVVQQLCGLIDEAEEVLSAQARSGARG